MNDLRCDRHPSATAHFQVAKFRGEWRLYLCNHCTQVHYAKLRELRWMIIPCHEGARSPEKAGVKA